MVGSKSATLSSSAPTTVNVTVNRLIARVSLNSLKADFAGMTYAGKPITNVSVYLAYLPDSKTFANTDPAGQNIISGATYSETTAITGMIADAVSGSITSSVNTTAHHFYTYERSAVSNLTGQDCVRLVVKGDLDTDNNGVGETYYWSIPVNTEKGGYKAANGHYGVKANYTYAYDVTITRAGAGNDYQDLEYATMTAAVTIADWTNITTETIQF